jgi:hypothetical protein
MSVRIESFSTDNSFFFIPTPSNEGGALDDSLPIAGSPTSTRMEFSAVSDGEKRTLVFEGNFQFTNGTPKTTLDLTKVSGQVTSLNFILNDTLFESDSFAPGVSLQQLIYADSSVAAAQNVFSGNDVFIAAKNPGPQDYGDIVDGFAGNDTFYGNGSGSQYQDVFYGGAGIDTSVFAGPKSNYRIQKNSDVLNVYNSNNRLQGYDITGLSSGGKQEVSGMERLQFTDGMVALDMAKGENGYKAAMLTATVLGRNKMGAYFDDVLALFDQGYSTATLAQKVVEAKLIETAAGATSNSAFVSEIYKNLTDTLPSAQSVASLVSQLDSGSTSRAALLVTVAEHAAVEAQINLTGLQSGGLFYNP